MTVRELVSRMLERAPKPEKDACVFCDTCGDCLTCEPDGCWCVQKARGASQ